MPDTATRKVKPLSLQWFADAAALCSNASSGLIIPVISFAGTANQRQRWTMCATISFSYSCAGIFGILSSQSIPATANAHVRPLTNMESEQNNTAIYGLAGKPTVFNIRLRQQIGLACDSFESI
jgi:hypothetical protein